MCIRDRTATSRRSFVATRAEPALGGAQATGNTRETHHHHQMIVGVPREIKPGEQRVALTPAGARELSEAGHGVLVERGAGVGSGIGDEEYVAAGAALDTV